MVDKVENVEKVEADALKDGRPEMCKGCVQWCETCDILIARYGEQTKSGVCGEADQMICFMAGCPLEVQCLEM